MKVFLNGEILPLEEAKLSLKDRGLLYGDGVFESLRTFSRRPFLLEEHLKRLSQGARLLKIKLPYSIKQLKNAVFKIIASNRFKEHYLKIIVTRGKAKGHGLDLSNSIGEPTVIIAAEELNQAPKNLYLKGWRAVISSIYKANNPTARIKSLCYLDNLLAKAEARQAGADEAFLLDDKGNVVEGTISNLFIVKLGTIYTPPAEAPILCGITRNFVLRLAKESALPTVEKLFDTKELYNCDECFVTLSGLGIVPITKLWHKKIGNGRCGSVTQQLISLYQMETGKK